MVSLVFFLSFGAVYGFSLILSFYLAPDSLTFLLTQHFLFHNLFLASSTFYVFLRFVFDHHSQTRNLEADVNKYC